MKKILISITALFFLLSPTFTYAQTDGSVENNANPGGETFEAVVLQILETNTFTRDNGTEVTQQNILLEGLSGSFEDQQFEYHGISDLDVLNMSNTVYEPGDKVLVNTFKDAAGIDEFYILNYVRRGYLYILAFLFALTIIVVGRMKGVRALLSLIVSFLIITKFIIPQILAGNNPLMIAIIGSIGIMGLIIYITEGVNKKTHIALVSIVLSLIATFLLSYIFVKITHLTGFASEEASFLAGRPDVATIDFRSLLLAAILIGTLGVLDDVILGQIETVYQIKKLNPDISHRETILAANEVGRTHLSSMVNTLFLTYAGASLPLLILFTVNPNSAVTLSNALDNESIATEVIRTLAGSIGLLLAFPITTYLAVYFLKADNTK